MLKVNSMVKDCMKRIFSVLLCVVLVFVVSFRKPVKAEAVVTTVGATIGLVALMSTITCALGLGIAGEASNQDFTYYYRQIGNAVINKITANGKSASDFVTHPSPGNYSISDEFVQDTFEEMQAVIPQENIFGIQLTKMSISDALGWDYANFAGTTYGLQAIPSDYLKNPVAISLLKLSANKTVSLGAMSVDFIQSTGTDLKVNYTVPTGYEVHFYSAFFNFDSGRDAFIAACPYNGSFAYYLVENNFEATTLAIYPTTATAQTPTQSTFKPQDKGFYAQGHSVMNNSYDEVMAKIHAAQGTLDNINVRINDAVGSLQEINDEIKAQTQSQVLGTTIADTATDAAANEATNAGRDTTVPKAPSIPDISMPSAIQRKFPFCLPFDFVNSIKTLQAPKKPPVVTVPLLNVPAWHWDYKVTLDWEQFDKNGVLAGLVRWAFSILWSIGLIFVTKKLIWK